MNKYAGIACDAAVSLRIENSIDYFKAWNQAALQYFEKYSTSYDKSCPRNAFLGLCEAGLIKGIRGAIVLNEKVIKEQKNKYYAVRAVELLNSNPKLAKNKKMLWSKVVNGEIKKHNSQMDIVVALWEKELILG